mmetsp:Transcript_8442/g.13735  ORF Transcript_8442/g.13735 Transcript_8442/m.13735 type:complete len:223 (+) Transcript_8442:118-786(+)
MHSNFLSTSPPQRLRKRESCSEEICSKEPARSLFNTPQSTSGASSARKNNNCSSVAFICSCKLFSSDSTSLRTSTAADAAAAAIALPELMLSNLAIAFSELATWFENSFRNDSASVLWLDCVVANSSNISRRSDFTIVRQLSSIARTSSKISPRTLSTLALQLNCVAMTSSSASLWRPRAIARKDSSATEAWSFSALFCVSIALSKLAQSSKERCIMLSDAS